MCQASHSGKLQHRKLQTARLRTDSTATCDSFHMAGGTITLGTKFIYLEYIDYNVLTTCLLCLKKDFCLASTSSLHPKLDDICDVVF